MLTDEDVDTFVRVSSILRSLPPIVRFMYYCEWDEASGCMLWKLPHNGNGYGQFAAGGAGNTKPAHRWIMEYFYGSIGARVVDHVKERCVNPDHLEIVSSKENNDRSGIYEVKRNQTHCKRGHEYTEDNTYRRKDRPTHRECKKCMKMRSRSYG